MNTMFIYFIILFFTCAICDIKPKQYIINLDTTQNERWNEVAADFKNESTLLRSIIMLVCTI